MPACANGLREDSLACKELLVLRQLLPASGDYDSAFQARISQHSNLGKITDNISKPSCRYKLSDINPRLPFKFPSSGTSWNAGAEQPLENPPETSAEAMMPSEAMLDTGMPMNSAGARNFNTYEGPPVPWLNFPGSVRSANRLSERDAIPMVLSTPSDLLAGRPIGRLLDAR
ncbi:hypothetical protein K469DRAFT_692126 [Zopfia rhizophila CBS 207.26]|uniref:Uncharacterized protein n=1 Tax=Zopfia rhizophila CBS 207.26 TaxID=1314779 RepID=A0A6A6DSQ9_9PEZI|nr:hypothetical protein K469DRAFT_692126 [Zopfia rhizophila CBS 207.26]